MLYPVELQSRFDDHRGQSGAKDRQACSATKSLRPNLLKKEIRTDLVHCVATMFRAGRCGSSRLLSFLWLDWNTLPPFDFQATCVSASAGPPRDSRRHPPHARWVDHELFTHHKVGKLTLSNPPLLLGFRGNTRQNQVPVGCSGSFSRTSVFIALWLTTLSEETVGGMQLAPS